MEGEVEGDPIERLRFFLSIALSGQDWLDVEQFIDNISKQLAAAQADNLRLRAALEMIAGKRLCIDNLMSNADIAREALATPTGDLSCFGVPEMIEPIESTPSLSALKTAVMQLRQRSDEIVRDIEGAAVRLRIFTQQVEIISECLDILLGDTEPAVEGRFPELNNHDKE